LDFYFAKKSTAIKFTEFLSSIVPTKVKTSEQLISRDEQNSVYNYKYTFSVELVPICREDLVYLPHSLAMSLGHISPLAICKRVTTNVVLLDPFTLKTADLQSAVYWRDPFPPLASVPQMVEFVILDIMPCGPPVGNMCMSDVAVVRASDFGRNDKQFFGKTHLGNVLRVGDSALGYDISTLNANSSHFERGRGGNLPDFILVKKFYHIRKQKKRSWKLQDLPKEVSESYKKKDVPMRDTEDYEYFLRELEEDKELRANVNLYKDQAVAVTATDEEMTDGEVDDIPQVPLEELLDGLSIQDVEMGSVESSFGAPLNVI